MGFPNRNTSVPSQRREDLKKALLSGPAWLPWLRLRPASGGTTLMGKFSVSGQQTVSRRLEGAQHRLPWNHRFGRILGGSLI